MNIVIAMDKFKGACSSFQACAAVAQGVLQAVPEAHIVQLPLSDGGDGLADVLAHYTSAQTVMATVHDPLFRPIQARYLIAADGKTAFIEMAQASGLLLLQPHEYNPMQTTTYGTGELIMDAVRCGVSRIVLGIGGSATNDCGIGMAAALGYRFLDKGRHELKPVGANLHAIETIDASYKINLDGITVIAASDVDNLLTGDAGAARVYAPQKGATPAMVEQLEKGVQHFAEVTLRDLGTDVRQLRGGGAAGGLGAGCVLFLKAQLQRGAELVLQYSDAVAKVQQADLVITGEGKLDAQSLYGKVVHGVARLATQHNKPAVALCGTLDVEQAQLQKAGITAAFSILNAPVSLHEAMLQTEPLLREAALAVANFFKTSYCNKLWKL